MFAASGNTARLPLDYNTVTPFLSIRNADQAMKLYQDVFGAIEQMRLNRTGGKIARAA